MKKKVHKFIATLHIKKVTTFGTACKVENKTSSYQSAISWKEVNCKKCLAFLKKYGL
jgi:hypothetical protein